MHHDVSGNPFTIDNYVKYVSSKRDYENNLLSERFDEMRFNDESVLFSNRYDETVYSVESIYRIGTEDYEADIDTVRLILAKITNPIELKNIFEEVFNSENDRYEVGVHLADSKWPEYQFTFYIEKLFANTLFSDDYIIQICNFSIHRLLYNYNKNLVTKEDLVIFIKNNVSIILNSIDDEIIKEIKSKNLLISLSEILANELCSSPEYILEMFEILYKNQGVSLFLHHAIIFNNYLIKFFNINGFYETKRLGESNIPFTIEYINRFRSIMTNQLTAENYGELQIMMEDKINRKISEHPFYKSIIPKNYENFQSLMGYYGLDYTYFQTYLKIVEHKLIQGTNLLQDFSMEE